MITGFVNDIKSAQLSEYICLYPDSYSDTIIDNTVLIACSHDENDFDFKFIDSVYNVTRTIIQRVEGGFKSDGQLPGGKYTMYQDLQFKPVILNAVPYNTYRLTVGNNIGVPNWVIDKLNRIFSCSSVKIDNVEYTRAEGAKFEPVNRDPFYPSGIWTIDLLKSENPYSDEMDYVVLPETQTLFTADTTQVSADDETITIDQEYI